MDFIEKHEILSLYSKDRDKFPHETQLIRALNASSFIKCYIWDLTIQGGIVWWKAI